MAPSPRCSGRVLLMSRRFVCAVLSVAACCLTGLGAWYTFRPPTGPVPNGPGGEGTGHRDVVPAETGPAPADPLGERFATRVRPFLERYCFSCHGPTRQEAGL